MEEKCHILTHKVFIDFLLGSQALTNNYLISQDHFQRPALGWYSPYWKALMGAQFSLLSTGEEQ